MSQAEVSRTESDPDSIPAWMLNAWVAACGGGIAFTGAVQESPKALDVGSPYAKLARNVALLDEYTTSVRGSLPGDATPEHTDEIRTFVDFVYAAAQKPLVGVFGKFDAGKSTLLNAVLGRDALVTRYQPTTRLPTLLFHSSERPQFVRHAASILDTHLSRYTLLHDANAYREHLLIDGPTEILHRYGQHSPEEARDAVAERAELAVLFLDAPILKACTLLDSPGFDADETDSETAQQYVASVDVAVCCSTATGFLDQFDLSLLNDVIDRVAPPAPCPGPRDLSRLFIVATQAGPHINEGHLKEIFANAANRASRAIEAVAGPGTAPPAVLGERFFPFFLESPERQKAFRDALGQLVGTTLPETWLARIDDAINSFRRDASDRLSHAIDGYRSWLQEYETKLEEAREELARIRETAPLQERAMAARFEELMAFINDCERASMDHLDETWRQVVNVGAIEQLLRREFSSRKEAQDQIGAHIVRLIEGRVKENLRGLSTQVAERTQHFIDQYQAAFLGQVDANSPVWTGLNFGGAFASGLVGLAGIGAMAAWAATLGNLGAYILVAKTVSVLATLGVSLPAGVATAVSLVAAIGGPITLAIAGVVIATLLGLSLVGAGWQSRLAKRVVKVFADKEVRARFRRVLHTHWLHTKEAAKKGEAAMREEWQRRVSDLEKIASNSDAERISYEATAQRLSEVRHFFVNLPWIPLG